MNDIIALNLLLLKEDILRYKPRNRAIERSHRPTVVEDTAAKNSVFGQPHELVGRDVELTLKGPNDITCKIRVSRWNGVREAIDEWGKKWVVIYVVTDTWETNNDPKKYTPPLWLSNYMK